MSYPAQPSALLRKLPVVSRLAYGALWTVGGATLSKAAGLSGSVVVARLLGLKGYGEFGIVQSTFTTLALLAAFGLGITVMKHVAEFQESEPARAGGAVAIALCFAALAGVTIALATWFAAPWLAQGPLAAPHLATTVRYLCAAVLLTALAAPVLGALGGLQAFRAIALISLASGISATACTVTGAWYGGLNGAALGLSAGPLVDLVLGSMVLREALRARAIHLRLREGLAEAALLHRFSLPSLLASAMVGPSYWLCASILVNRPGGYEQMGIFQAANQWFAAVMFVPEGLGRVSLPILAHMLGKGGSGETIGALKSMCAFNATVVLPPILVIAWMSPRIMRLYGADHESSWLVLCIVLSAAGLSAIAAPAGSLLAARGRQWTGFALNAAWAITFVGMTWLLQDAGASGLAIALLVAYLVHSATVGRYALRRLTDTAPR
jgi:O-antigen/teichoic acid export membrane protein